MTLIYFDNEVTIERPRSEVFEYVSDLTHLPDWNYAIEETTKQGHGPPEQGSVYHQRRSLPRGHDEVLTIDRLDEPDRLTVVGRLGPFDATVDYEFSEEGGSTRLVNTVELESTGVTRLVQPLVAGRIRNEVRSNLETLKTILEG